MQMPMHNVRFLTVGRGCVRWQRCTLTDIRQSKFATASDSTLLGPCRYSSRTVVTVQDVSNSPQSSFFLFCRIGGKARDIKLRNKRCKNTDFKTVMLLSVRGKCMRYDLRQSQLQSTKRYGIITHAPPFVPILFLCLQSGKLLQGRRIRVEDRQQLDAHPRIDQAIRSSTPAEHSQFRVVDSVDVPASGSST